MYIFKLEAVFIFSIFVFVYFTILNKTMLLTNSIDSLTRIDLNLPQYNSIYFLWTNLDYIYLYFIVLILFALLLNFKLNCLKNYTVIMTLMLVPMIWITLFVGSCSTYSQSIGCTNNVNLLLFNSINKYHPLLLYTSVLILMLLTINYSYANGVYKARIYLNNVSRFWVKALVTIVTTMYAGSWWAYQEGSWGGWWAWDSSETFGLVIVFVLIALVHLNFFIRKIKLVKHYYYIAILLILLNYLSLQLNFGITSHNFGLKDSSDSIILDYYTKLLMLFLSIFVLMVYSCYYKLITRSFIKKLNTKFNYYTFIICIPIFTSLAPLLTDLLWKMYELNTINFNSNYYLLSGLLVSIIFQWFNYTTSGKLAYLVIFILLELDNYSLGLALLISFLVLKLTKFNKVHLIILVYLYISWASNNYMVNYWVSDIYCNNIISTNLNLVKHPLLIKSETNNFCDATYSILSDSSTAINSGIFFLSHSISEYQQVFLSDNTRVGLVSTTFDDLTFLIPLCSYILINYMFKPLAAGYIIKC
jgi:cytochrome c biogenesis factor